MQKFTIFSIILSVVVVLSTLDVLFHDYLNAGTSSPSTEITESGASSEGSETPLTLPTTTDSTDGDTQTDVQLQEDNGVDTVSTLPSLLSAGLFKEAGFATPTLKDTPFSGLVFQFLNFSESSGASVYQWNLFEGPVFVGSVYELRYSTDTGGFQAYLDLRDEAKSLTDIGEVNEVNNYGDASFYFNHKTKTKTIHLLIRVGSNLYAFEYAQNHHETMKNVFDILKTVQ